MYSMPPPVSNNAFGSTTERLGRGALVGCVGVITAPQTVQRSDAPSATDRTSSDKEDLKPGGGEETEMLARTEVEPRFARGLLGAVGLVV
eukprot:3518758-Amphidinium_carterae.1